ncbi:MAG: site-2 protease family protein [Acidimicrobiales bacterium]
MILHEVSHGVVALAFGDDTAKRAGRITLNPIRHVDPFGTLILPGLLALAGLPAFGWAKPVPVNVRKLRNPRQQSLYVSLAGPATNLLIAAVLAVAWQLWATRLIGSFLGELVFFAGLLNVVLALFNLLPIPPLDGSAILERFLPDAWWPRYLVFRRWSIVGLLVLMLVVSSRGGSVIFEPARWLWRQMAL